MTRSVRQGPYRRSDMTELTADERYELESGEGLLQPFYCDVELLRSAWSIHGDTITSEWVAHHPGSRPFCWFLFVGYPQFGPRRTTKYFRRIEPYRAAWARWGILCVDLLPPVLESQTEYLDRIGQLSDEERAIIGPVVSAETIFEQNYPDLSCRIIARMEQAAAAELHS